jgi:hypothetical protein
MKYIKKYELMFSEDILVGNYYLIEFVESKYKAKCLDIKLTFEGDNSKYGFEVLEEDTGHFFKTRISYYDIVRELELDEIEIYKIKNQEKKYNL